MCIRFVWFSVFKIDNYNTIYALKAIKYAGVVKNIDEHYLMEIFINESKEEISAEARLYEPKNLSDAMTKAHRLEENKVIVANVARISVTRTIIH